MSGSVDFLMEKQAEDREAILASTHPSLILGYGRWKRVIAVLTKSGTKADLEIANGLRGELNRLADRRMSIKPEEKT